MNSNPQESRDFPELLKSIEEAHEVPGSGSAFKGVFRDSDSPNFQQTRKAFEQIEEDGILMSTENRENPFKIPTFDENYKTHSICEEWNSGRQGNMLNLEYTESADRLLRIIGNGVVKNGYNMFMAPGQSQRPPVTTNVSVAVYIESMSSFRAQTMDYEVDMYLAMGWYDRRLAHNCTHPILVTHKFIADRIWQPDLYFVNSKFAYLQEVTTPNFMLIVYPDGLIFKSMRIDVTLSCMMDLKNFPTDKQECPMIIQSYAYVENLVNLSWHVDPPNFPIGSNAEIKLNDMIITGTKYETCESPYPMFRGYDLPQVAYIKMLDLWLSFNQALIFLVLLEYAFVSYYLTRRNLDCEHRKPLSNSPSFQKEFKKFRSESPIAGLTAATPLIHQNGSTQVGVGATQMGVGPNGTYLRQRHSSMDSGHPRLSQQNSTFSITAGCVNSAAALMTAHTNTSYSKFDLTKPCPKCAYENEIIARKIDQYSRIIFPTAFTIFCIAYWFYYGWWDGGQ
ncbi:hypothetical protein FO519_003832 [Halicephalobus sp. NKZ332]|nr:hypothetical protein FO519_003832 [Halicephalobus sp. NKZ332]